MAQSFFYKAVSSSGKVHTGKIAADTEREAAISLQQKGLIPLKIDPADGKVLEKNKSSKKKSAGLKKAAKISLKSGSKGVFQKNLSFSFFQKVSNKELIMFAEDLAILLESGIPLNKGLSILTELTEKKRFQTVIRNVHERIREGSTLWEALQAHSTVFPPVFVNMVKAGENGGVLDLVLRRISEYLDGVQEIRDYLISAMIYPAFLTLTAVGSVIVLLTFVIPKFASIFEDMGMSLPLATQIMMDAGNFFQKYWLVMIVGGAVCLAGFRYYIRTPAGQRQWDNFKLRMPLFGNIIRKIEISRFSRTLGTLLASGVSILMAMRIVRGVVINSVLNDSLEKVYEDLKQGEMLSRSIEKTGLFPTLAMHMIGVGEETGRLEVMLNKVADIYDKELRAAIKALTSLLEPMIILVMGLMIGALIVSMLMAIFSVNDINV